MAKSQKKHTPSPHREITAPKALVPLMQAFHVDSEEVAHSLIIEAAKAISFSDDMIFGKKDPSEEEIEAIASLMKGINPRDTLETLYAAQVVACHMMGMRKLASTHPDDQRLGLHLLKFSNESMQQLEKKRNGGTQNITVNYNYNGQGNAVSQTVIKEK